MDSKVIELINRHDGFLDANEISVLTKINYRRVRKDIQRLNNQYSKVIPSQEIHRAITTKSKI
ncbi:MAG TPA: hypothetical protein PKL04_08930 [Methanofastidiosum sp.]|jgi:Fic family protein|nr:hypothetical protein [Methanofastidiosum sp.]